MVRWRGRCSLLSLLWVKKSNLSLKNITFLASRVVIFFILVSPLFGGTQGSNLVNHIRKKCGMISLKYSQALAKSAHNHAKYLARLRLNSHKESPRYPYFTGRTPFDRIAKVGFGSRVGVEDISFGEQSYRGSVNTLFGTIYHRLAFLDFRIDSIGTSAYGNLKGRVYVYDMASSQISKICRKNYRSGGKYIFGVCSNPDKKLPLSVMQGALRRVQRRNAKIVVYPYPNATVGRRFINEVPKPFGKNVRMGFPVSVELNPAIYSWGRLESFKIFDSSGRRVQAKIITSKSDIHRKIPKLTYILVPRSLLKSGNKYRVSFQAKTNRGRVKKEWSFFVK